MEELIKGIPGLRYFRSDGKDRLHYKDRTFYYSREGDIHVITSSHQCVRKYVLERYIACDYKILSDNGFSEIEAELLDDGVHSHAKRKRTPWFSITSKGEDLKKLLDENHRLFPLQKRKKK